MPTAFEKEVQENVARLLTMVCTENTDPETYEFVLKKLTRMAILGTAPPSCRARKYDVPATVPETAAVSESAASDDFSAKKESFMAP
jgi:hypothetical protein